jgi:soluble lytic murein transglycosylase-like protein
MSRKLRFPPVLSALLAAFVLWIAPPGFADAQAPLFIVAETRDLDPDDSESPKFLVLPAIPEETEDARGTPSVAPPTYDSSVVTALKKMGLSPQHLDLWIQTQPESALQDLASLPGSLQRSVANVALYIRSHNSRVSPKVAWREAAALVKYTGRYGLPLPLAVAVAHTESRFDPNSQSNKGAMGVMQVVWRVHNGLLQAHGIETKRQMFDPEKGIAAGCLLLSRYLKAYGTAKKAIDRYYGGVADGYWRAVQDRMQRLVAHAAKNGL